MAASLLALLLALPAAAELRLELRRPGGAETALGVSVSRVFRSGSVPCPGARVVLTLPSGLESEEKAEASGTARFDPRNLSYSLPPAGAATVRAKAECAGSSGRADFSLSGSELTSYSRESSSKLTDEGVRLAGSKRFAEARLRFIQALELDPASARARFNLALCAERLGLLRLAASEYVQYLSLHPEAQDRASLGRKVARMARGLNPGLPLPKVAADLFETGRSEAAAGRYNQALAAFSAAQVLAPWWPEPYRASGLLRESLAMRGKGAFAVHAEAALSDLETFLEASPGDTRAADIRARTERLRSIRSGLNAPQRIRIK